MSTAAIQTERKALLGRCGFTSLTEVDRVNGFTKVLYELQVLQGTSLQAGLEAEDPTINQARTIRHHILTELVPCLELYIDDVAAYIREIIQDKNRWWKIDRPAREMTLMDLNARPIFKTDRSTGCAKAWPSPLEQVRFTLQARLNDKRRAAGVTIHEMKIKAGVACSCAKCAQRLPECEIETEPATNPF